MPKRKDGGPRIYRRGGGWHVDLRQYGGGRVALKAPGDTRATTDRRIALHLAAQLVKDLEAEKRTTTLLGLKRTATLEEMVSEHLVAKARSGAVTHAWIAESEAMLRTAVEFFGADRKLDSIGVADVRAYAAHLQQRPGGRKGRRTLSPGRQRHHLNVLSNLFRRAQSEGVVQPGHNPVASLLEKPRAAQEEARWLETHEAALLLESARTYVAPRPDIAVPYAHALLATFLLTGGREAEVLGLEVDDVSFDRRTVTFRPNGWRRLKTRTSHRTVPMWPQLEEVLRAHVYGAATPRVSGLLFPSPARERPSMLTDIRKLLDAIAERAGWRAREIRSKMFRHTYCAARLQTLDRGEPVSVYTVAREMGHGGDSLVKRVYGHLGDVRHRAEVVEYRPAVIESIADERVREAFRDRLRAVRTSED